MRGERGWIPVINNQWRQSNRDSITTLFVDNLPEEIRNVWVKNLFSKYGRVRDIFIPNNRSKITGMRFGFIRFARKDESVTAITKTNDTWVWDQKLVVKMARFDNIGRTTEVNSMHVTLNRRRNTFQPSTSYFNNRGDLKKNSSFNNIGDTKKRIIQVWRPKEKYSTTKRHEPKEIIC